MNLADRNTINDMFTMFRMVAPVLTGRRCQVRARAPFDPGAWGICINQSDGSSIIDINPSIPFETTSIFADFRKLYMIFLHECGHARLYHGDASIGDVASMLPPNSFSFDRFYKKTEHDKQVERQADVAAAIWDTLAAQNSASALVWWNRIGILSHIVQTPETIRLAALARPVLAQQYLTMIGALPAGRKQR